MGETTSDERTDGTEYRLRVDDRGRVTIPKELREQLGIELGGDVVAYRSGSTLTVDPAPSERLETATAGRDDWTGTTPTDAGRSLFGPRPDPESGEETNE